MIQRDQLLSLQRPKSHCHECGVALDEFDRHPTRLRMLEDEPERADFCPDCWEFVKEEAYHSYWITRRVRREKRAVKLSRRERAVAARALFESLWEKREQEEIDAHLYFLAHLLLRWGGLKWVRNDVDSEGREIIVFENPATGDPIEIRSVDISQESISETKEHIEEFLRQYAPESEIPLD